MDYAIELTIRFCGNFTLVFASLLRQLPALRARIGSVCLVRKCHAAVLFLALASLLLALLPMAAAGDTKAPEAAGIKHAQKPAAAQGKTELGNPNQVCLGCHKMSEEEINQQPRQAQKKHRKTMEEQGPCTECHNKATIICCHDNLFYEL